jgi:hypothetical protein
MTIGSLNAQIDIEIIEQEMTMSKGTQPAYIVEIPQAERKNIEKSWTKYIRQDTKSKVETEGEEIFIIGTMISKISNEPINIYSAVIEMDSTVKVISLFEIDSVFFSLPEGNKDINLEKTYHGIKNFLKDFVIDEYREAVMDELKEEELILKTLLKEMIAMEKNNVSFQKEIKELELKIKGSEEDIASLESEKARKMTEIESKKLSINSLSGDEILQDEAKKHLKLLEKEKKGIEKDIEKEHKNIVSYESGIIENNRSIERNLLNQDAKLKEISEQELVVESVTNKLEEIK